MKPLRTKFLNYTVIIAGMLLLTACPGPAEPDLSVSPSKLTFEAGDIKEQSITIDTDAKNWNYSFNSNWIRVYKSNDANDKLFVSVDNYSNTNESRFTTITVTADKATPVDVTIEQLKKESLAINPASLSYAAKETGTKTVSITTNVTTWDAQVSSSNASWITCNKWDQQTLSVTVSSENTQSSERSADIMIIAGNATPQILKVTQAKQDIGIGDGDMPIRTIYNYRATGTPMQTSGQGFNHTSWTGIIIPNISSQFIHIYNWASSDDAVIWLDWVNGRFQLDVTNYIFQDAAGYEGYLCMCTYNSAGVITPHPGVNYAVNYNPATQTIDFSGTYNGLPTCIAVIPKNPATDQWLTDSYYLNIYSNLKIELIPVAYAPGLRSSGQVNNDRLLKKTVEPNAVMRKFFIEPSTNNR